MGEERNSACALIGLAGIPRGMLSGAKIGFHAANVNGQENGQGSALIGSYMTRLGLGYAAVGWATNAGPTSVSYLAPEIAKEIGIDVNVLSTSIGLRNRCPARCGRF